MGAETKLGWGTELNLDEGRNKTWMREGTKLGWGEELNLDGGSN